MRDSISLSLPKGNWFVAILGLLFGLFLVPVMALVPDSKPTPAPLLWVLFSVLQLVTYFCINLIGILLFHRIDADTNGIRWRTLRGKRHAPWAEVTDFYEKFPASRSFMPRNSSYHKPYVPDEKLPRELWIVTTQGTFQVGIFLQGDIEAFRECVCQNAISAATRTWELKGTRSCDVWPYTFSYATPERRFAAVISGTSVALYIVLAAVGLWNLCVRCYSPLGTGAVVTLYGLLWLLAIWPALFLVGIFIHYLLTLCRHREGITVTMQGFTCRLAGGEILTGDWNSVYDYYCVERGYFQSLRYVVALTGSEEQKWTFTSQIKDSHVLQALIRKCAPPPLTVAEDQEPWSSKRDESRLTSTNGRVYHYRTYMTKSMLIMGCLLCGAFPVGALIQKIFEIPARPNDSPMFVMGLFLVMTALLAYSWWRYFVGGIEIDDFWITQRTLFGRRRLLWLAVSDYKSIGDPYIVCGSKGRPIAFWTTISHFEELKAEIESRSPIPTTGWNKGTTTLKSRKEKGRHNEVKKETGNR